MVQMDKNFEELCYACRIGDLDNVDRLITTGVNLNSVDRFDNSPLFLASLCGHKDIVLLLLKSGAICDRDRYEGARCIYGALTDVIRDILLSYDISKAVDVSQPFASHISSLFLQNQNNNDLNTFDMNIVCIPDNKEVLAHKFIIQARCSLLFEQLVSLDSFNYKTNLSSHVLDIILKMIYLVPILHVIRQEDLPDLEQLTRKLQIDLFSSYLNKVKLIRDPSAKSTLMAEYQFKFTMHAKNQLKDFVNKCIIGSSFASNCENDDIHTDKLNACELRSKDFSFLSPDVVVKVEDKLGYVQYYPCHLSILKRFDYFGIMFVSPFKELASYTKYIKETTLPDTNKHLCLLTLNNISREIFEIILKYLYYDESEIELKNCLNVIKTADFLLDDRLKTIAGTIVTQNDDILNFVDIFEILYFAWATRIERLEHFVAKHIAIHLSSYINRPDFKNAILKSAERIANREELDSIELIDDIRFYLLELYKLEVDDIEYLESLDDVEIESEVDFLRYKKECESINNVLIELNLHMFKITK